MMITLDKLKPGSNAVIESVDGDNALRHHLLDMGLIPGIPVKMMKAAPMGDPIEIKIRGYVLTLRKKMLRRYK